MTDAWFSRPGPLRTEFGEVEPDLEAITFGLDAMAVDSLAVAVVMAGMPSGVNVYLLASRYEAATRVGWIADSTALSTREAW